MKSGVQRFSELPEGVWDFFFIRHGESQGNKERIIQGHTDYPLTDLGLDHARGAGEWFTTDPPELIFSSPLGRARSTAEAIASEIGVPVRKIQYWDTLKELDTGVFSGRKVDDIIVQDPGLWDRFLRESWEGVPGAESVNQLQARAQKVWEQLCAEAMELSSRNTQTRVFRIGGRGLPHHRLLSVSHGGIIQWIVKASFASHYTQWTPVIKIGNCGIFQLQVRVLESGSHFSEWKLFNHLTYKE